MISNKIGSDVEDILSSTWSLTRGSLKKQVHFAVGYKTVYRYCFDRFPFCIWHSMPIYRQR